MREDIPQYLREQLLAQYGEADAERIARGYEAKRRVTLRVNRLRSTPEAVRAALEAAGIAVTGVPWSEDALILEGVREDAVTALPLYERGEVYLQNLSSMIPPLFLGAQPGENLLDMAAAPGGKTTQIAALTGGKAMITACERNSARAERMKHNLAVQGAAGVTVMNIDARQLDDLFAFDRILLDAPCSGSGTVQLGEKTKARFGREYLEKNVKTQAALLDKALRLLKPGHEMIYSTCSVLDQENGQQIARAVKKAGAEVVPLDLSAFEGMPTLPVSVPGTLCVCPDENYEGFFVAKLRRKAKKK
ncbi:MAG: RsmB/NOP family class I SAM-dependent RNA methyltransferase [Clostridia bacterium]|nr:RsmB/NOP family class I SAM-dependent RNA methyltransferase [Clostridia bacterium]